MVWCRYGAVLVLQGAMTLGDLNAFMLYAIYVAGSAGGLAGTAASVIAAVSQCSSLVQAGGQGCRSWGLHQTGAARMSKYSAQSLGDVMHAVAP